MRTHYGRTPTRIDLAGGWTDVPRFAEVVPGAVLNVAISLYSHVTISESSHLSEPASGTRVPRVPTDDSISMYSVDFDEREDLPASRLVHETELRGSFGLVKAALRRRGVDRGLQIVTRCEAPPGSGLGTSASMGVALIGALNRVMGVYETPDASAETAVRLETEELGILSGKQDHYAAALGGVHYMTFRGPHVSCVRLPLSRESLADMQRRIVLVYTGRSRLSGDVHTHVHGRFESREPGFTRILEDLSDLAGAGRDALLRGSFDELGKVVNANWDLQRALHPAITTSDIEDLCAIGLRSGAVGVKACGAGGGGCLLFVCEDGAEGRVARALSESDVTPLTFDLASWGLLSWSKPSPAAYDWDIET